MSKRGITATKPLTEFETRKQMFSFARRLGCDIELRQIFDKYDRLLKDSKGDVERHQIAILANVEVHRLFGFKDALVVNGQVILPADENYKPEE